MPDAAIQPDPPRCWSCGYDLTGLRVEGACPECGTSIWSSSPRAPLRPSEKLASVLGVVSLLMPCFGPFACIPGVVAVTLSLRTLHRASAGRASHEAVSGAYFALVAGGMGTAIGAFMGAALYYEW